MDKKKKRRLIAALSVLGLLTAVFAVLNSPVFELKEVAVEGEQVISEEEIKRTLGLTEGTNLFRYFVKHFGKEQLLDRRFKSMDVYLDWPDAARIEVEEEGLIGCLYFQGAYLCINRYGIVMETESGLPEALPLVRGVTVGSFVLGEVPVTDDNGPFETVLSVGSVLGKYGLNARIREISVRNADDIVLYAEGLEIRCGSCEDIDEKLYVVKCLWESSPDIRGILHLENPEGQIYLEGNS